MQDNMLLMTMFREQQEEITALRHHLEHVERTQKKTASETLVGERIDEVRAELQQAHAAEIKKLREEMKADLASMNEVMKDEVASMKEHVKKEVASSKEEMTMECATLIAQAKSQVKQHCAELDVALEKRVEEDITSQVATLELATTRKATQALATCHEAIAVAGDVTNNACDKKIVECKDLVKEQRQEIDNKITANVNDEAASRMTEVIRLDASIKAQGKRFKLLVDNLSATNLEKTEQVMMDLTQMRQDLETRMTHPVPRVQMSRRLADHHQMGEEGDASWEDESPHSFVESTQRLTTHHQAPSSREQPHWYDERPGGTEHQTAVHRLKAVAGSARPSGNGYKPVMQDRSQQDDSSPNRMFGVNGGLLPHPVAPSRQSGRFGAGSELRQGMGRYIRDEV